MKELSVDLKELRKQIDALNVSNTSIDEKEGLHNLLGSIYDSVLEDGQVIMIRWKEQQMKFDKTKKKSSALNFLEFRSMALQSVGLVKDFPPNHWSKDDLENWVKEEWKKHQGC